jgi:(S)-2-hydroxy-acid oxidase
MWLRRPNSTSRERSCIQSVSTSYASALHGLLIVHSLKILPRVLRDVSKVETSTSLFGRSYSLPFGLAPSAMQKLAGGEGEMDVARAAVKLGVNLTLSSQSTTSLEDVMSCKKNSSSAADPAFWMQLYLTKDPEKSVPLIKRAEGSFFNPKLDMNY